MEKDKNIILPEPIHIKKINTKLDLFTKNNVIRKWKGYDIIDTLFYLYLFNKYKQNCLIKYEGVVAKNALGVELQIKDKLSAYTYRIYNKHLRVVSKQLADCIKKNLESIVIPLYLKTSTGGHANLLIYRKKDHIIEHFEPHGSKYMSANKNNNQMIEIQLIRFIKMLNSELKKNNQPFVKLIPSNEVCPYIDGLQSLEEDARQKETIPYQGPGLCSAWSMFFTELTLKNPTISSNELLNIIMNKFDKEPDKQAKYIRQIIIGYINLIYDKLLKYFYFITGMKSSIEDIYDMLNTNNKYYIDKFFIDYDTIININNALFNDPSLTKKDI